MLAHQALLPGPAVLGFSGGPDSLALLHLLLHDPAARHVQVSAVHVHHNLRGAAADADAEFCARTCAAWGVPFHLVRADVPTLVAALKLGVEEAARRARYTALADQARTAGADVILTAHTADDQAETVLLHLMRGAGLAGLSGMGLLAPLSAAHLLPATGDPAGLRLGRPLLKATRPQVEAYCAAHGLQPRQDATNDDQRYSRSRVRHSLIPLMQRFNPAVVEALNRAAETAAIDHAYIQAQVEQAWQQALSLAEPGLVTLDRAAWLGQHPALQRGLIRRAAAQALGHAPELRLSALQNALDLAQAGATGARADLGEGLRLRLNYGQIIIERHDAPDSLPDAPFIDAEVIIDGPGEYASALGWAFRLQRAAPAEAAGRWSAAFDVDKLRFPLLLRARQAGDRISLSGGSRTLKEFMIDEKIPRAQRDYLPLLVQAGRVLWVCGWRIDAAYAASPDAPQAWLAEWIRR